MTICENLRFLMIQLPVLICIVGGFTGTSHDGCAH